MPSPSLLPDLLDALDTLSDGLSGGQLSAVEWHNAVVRELFAHHLAEYAAAADVPVDDPAVLKAVGQIVGRQVDYLGGFTDAVEAGDYDDSPDALRARAALYAGSLKESYWRGRTGDWPLPFMPAQDTDCHTNCQCGWRVDVIDEDVGDADAYWERHANDSCATCVEREDGNPYMIRNGELA